MKSVNSLKDLTFDAFDYLGRPTGKRAKICPYQDIKCLYIGYYGEGAFLVCNYDLEKCFKEENENRK